MRYRREKSAETQQMSASQAASHAHRAELCRISTVFNLGRAVALGVPRPGLQDVHECLQPRIR
jgi:hypothetical protein